MKGRQVNVEAAPKVVDTTGAGDAFNGAYLAARLQGLSPAVASQKAARLAAAVVVSHRSAIVPFWS